MKNLTTMQQAVAGAMALILAVAAIGGYVVYDRESTRVGSDKVDAAKRRRVQMQDQLASLDALTPLPPLAANWTRAHALFSACGLAMEPSAPAQVGSGHSVPYTGWYAKLRGDPAHLLACLQVAYSTLPIEPVTLAFDQQGTAQTYIYIMGATDAAS